MLNRALRLLRTYHQLSQQDLAKKLDLSISYLSEIETGLKAPSIDILQKYSELFRMPVSSIMLFAEEMGSSRKSGAKLRIASADRILKLLEWLEQRDVVSEST